MLENNYTSQVLFNVFMATVKICDYCGEGIDGAKYIRLSIHDRLNFFEKNIWQDIEICEECVGGLVSQICEVFPGLR